MAQIMLAFGGAYRYNLNSLSKNKVYQEAFNEAPCRIAGEYHHGMFTVGGVLSPLTSMGQAEALDEMNSGAGAAVGDFIGLFYVPVHHTLVDVAIQTTPTQSLRGYPHVNNSDGLVFDVVVKKVNKDTLQETGELALDTPITGVPANVATWKRSPVEAATLGHFNEDEFLVLGLKVAALPSDTNVKLSDITSRVNLYGHVMDYEGPNHI